MKRRVFSSFVLILSLLFLCSFPAFAGEWQEDDDGERQYIEEDGTVATGRTEVDDSFYYFDEDGHPQEECWKKSNGSWYYYGEDGEMETSTWVDNYYVDHQGRMTKTR